MSQEIDVGMAELLGAFIGDGWLEKRLKGIYIMGNISEDKDYYNSFLAPLFSKKLAKVTPKKFNSWRVYGIACYKSEVMRKCLNFGFQSGAKALIVTIPPKVMNSNNHVIKAVLRGIFDADGCFWCEKSRSKDSIEWKRIYHYHPEFQIGSCSKQLLEQIKILLNRLKIESKVVKKRNAGTRNNRNFNDSYALRIRKKSEIEKWFKIIGSNNPKHQTRYRLWKKYGFLPPRTTIKQRKDMLSNKLDPKSFY